MSSIVTQPTRGGKTLDRIYVNDIQYSNIKVIQSAVKSDHKAIIAYSGEIKTSIAKTRRKCTYRKRSPTQHAHFIESVHDLELVADPDSAVQCEFDRFYEIMSVIIDTYYPERSVTITSSDPPYVTPAVKQMLRRKNKLMRAGQIEKAAALSAKIGAAIIRYNSTELSRVDVTTDARGMWAKVRQLTGRGRSALIAEESATTTAEVLNNHYAAISHDSAYKQPSMKLTANIPSNHVTEMQIFDILDNLRQTAAGLDNIPSWFLKVGAPVFAAPIANLMNLSLSTSTVPRQWKIASILPVPKVTSPVTPSDFRPISITPVLSRMMERIVVKDFIYPSLHSPPQGLDFSDQFAFQPTASTTAALIHLLHTV